MLSVVRLLLAMLTLAAIGWQLWLHIEASYNALNFFSYFTNLSNLLAAVVLLLSVFLRVRRHSALDSLRYVSATNMVVVGLVFVALLRNVDLGALRPWVNIVLHYVMPIAIVLDWVIEAPRSRLTARHLLLALIFPTAYLVYVLLRGAASNWYPYPFLVPANVGGYGGVALYAIGIFVTFLAVGSALLAIGNRARAAASGNRSRSSME
ncbi:MAG: hypothetical protein EOP81_11920 [Variovorax sp.]|nr:MAG: hypothetical protein EOP81_11920 [Variovorax sp.]